MGSDSPAQEKYDRIYSEPEKAFWYRGEEAIAFLRQVSELVPPPAKVFDLGAGQGRDSILFAQWGYEVTALDVSPVGLARLGQEAQNQGLNIHTKVMDIANLEASDIDIVICNNVLHGFQQKQAMGIVDNIQRMTRAEGVNIILTFSNESAFTAMSGQEKYFYPKKEQIAGLYKHWQIKTLSTYKANSRQTDSDGKPFVNEILALIATKPSS